jgi:hypothetical protein
MRGRVAFWFGLVVGYVLGAKAGQERYQQIVDATKSFRDNPGIQRLTDRVQKTVSPGGEARVSASTSVADSSTRATASSPPGPVRDDGPPYEQEGQVETAPQAEPARTPLDR